MDSGVSGTTVTWRIAHQLSGRAGRCHVGFGDAPATPGRPHQRGGAAGKRLVPQLIGVLHQGDGQVAVHDRVVPLA